MRVHFPARAFGAGAERRYFDYLRSVNGTAEPVKQLKAWILDEFRRHEQGGRGSYRPRGGRAPQDNR